MSPAKPKDSVTPPEALPVVRLVGLRKVFHLDETRFVRKPTTIVAVNDVSLHVDEAEVVGLVGESGCGKTTLGRLALRLIAPSKGKVYFKDTEVTALGSHKLRSFRRHMQMIFQDPLSALNPRMRVADLVAEPLQVHGLARGRKQTSEMVLVLLEQVGLGPEHADRYPHEFSGGQRQRICIARALASRPSFVVADEPLSALDVSIQAQIINLLQALQDELGLAFLFVSHDLHVVGQLASRVAVMYMGRIVELGSTAVLFDEPLHPYTRALLDAVPVADPRRRGNPRPLLRGEAPNAADPPSGCPFHPRCLLKTDRCVKERPKLQDMGSGRTVACHEV